MTTEKFAAEVKTLENFFTLYCRHKHDGQKQVTIPLTYKEYTQEVTVSLCPQCEELLHYSLTQLAHCPHETKPRCRKCPAPCYEKQKWKKVAKVMRYSGVLLGVVKVKKLFRKSS